MKEITKYTLATASVLVGYLAIILFGYFLHSHPIETTIGLFLLIITGAIIEGIKRELLD